MEEASRRVRQEEFIKSGTASSETSEEDTNGMDSMWERRMKERMERIKSKKLRDTSLTVSQKGISINVIADAKQTTSMDEEGNPVTSGHGRIREELSAKKGSIKFLVGNDSGTVEICVQSIVASTNKPARIHLKVDMAASEEEENNDEYDGGSGTKKETPKDPEHLEHHQISSKMSRLERDLQTLQNRVKACINNADYNKDQEAIFHEQSISMNRASKYWPIIQLIVLIVTGFTQANHIVRYLKTHHIGF